jgi:hypothetical protein
MIELNEERHTEDMQEIISKIPSWIVKWGITLFFGIILTTLAISFLIRYPDEVAGNLKVTSVVEPIPLTSLIAGKLMTIQVQDGDIVKKGQVVAIIQSGKDQQTTYPLVAPTDGVIHFITIAQPGFYINADQDVFMIHALHARTFFWHHANSTK